MNEPTDAKPFLDVEQAVRERYSEAAQQAQPSLCCSVQYDRRYLEALPQELIDRDYGCGDPSKYVHEGETVLDLGSGGGKICYIASQIVGPRGRVIGVDANDEMLSLARRYQAEIASRIGWDNVVFRKGRIQDLALDLEQFDAFLQSRPVGRLDDWFAAQQRADQLRAQQPMIPDGSIDVVLSNCVLNLVRPQDRYDLLREIRRVLAPGGRVVISDIVSDRPVPAELRQDAQLWSGCISGAFQEAELLQVFEELGFHGIELVERQSEPWQTIDQIEFRSVTVRAWKAEKQSCEDKQQAAIYRGPWKSVIDEEGHVLHRGKPIAICAKSFERFSKAPYAHQVICLAPDPRRTAVEQAADCRAGQVRDPGAMQEARAAVLPVAGCCGPNGCC